MTFKKDIYKFKPAVTISGDVVLMRIGKLQWKRCFINKSASLSFSLSFAPLLLFLYQLLVVWPHYSTHSVNEALLYWSLYFAFCSRFSCNPRISTVYLLQYTWRQLESCEPPKTSSAPFITHVRHIITSTTKTYTTRCFSSWYVEEWVLIHCYIY